MKRHDDDLDRKLDGLLEGIREERLDADTADRAADRVWDTVRAEAESRPGTGESAGPIRPGDDYEALIPGYVAGTLSEAKRLLVEDHMRESVTFRKQVIRAREGGAAAEAVVPRSARRRVWATEWSWALAAAVLLTVSLVGLRFDLGILSVKTGGVVTIKQVDGELLRVNAAGAVPIRAGEMIRLDPGQDRIRTAKDSRAVLTLSDGSEVEMNERSQLAVLERHSRLGGERQDSTIQLDRGSVIVEAADQGDGRLFVETDQCKVEVTGTVFAVNHGMKGSRVSVFEGEVQVHAGRTDVLHPGDQVVTNPAVDRVPMDQEIAWSANVDRHLALLAELTQLGKELDQVVAGPAARHSTRLLDSAPANTAVYIAIPNFSGALGDAYEHVQARVSANPVLKQWWDESLVPSGADRELDRAIDKLRGYGEQLGEEIVVTLQADAAGDVQDPLILAQTVRPAEFRDLLIREFEQFAAAHENAPGLVIREGQPAAVTHDSRRGIKADLFVWLHDGLAAVSTDSAPIDALIAGGGGSPFGATAFRDRIAEVYRDGAEWLVAVDLERFMRDNAGDATLERMGLLDLRHLIVDRRDDPGRSDMRAVLSFNQARRGMASWLAAPAPMGSLDFVSQDASLAAAFVIREPAALLDELFSFIGSDDEDFSAELAEFEREHGFDIRKDFAEPLGGEFAFALDGPVLPKPSWKLVVEVYDPARLQGSIALALEQINRWRADEGRPGLTLVTEQVGARTFHVIRIADSGLEAHYAFVEGYLVATPSRVLLTRALELRENGVTLPRSHRFMELVPRNGQLNFSAVAYQHLGPVLAPAAGALRGLGSLSPEQAEMLRAITEQSAPTLTYAYGGRDRIVVATSSNQGLFESGLSLFKLQSLMELQRSVDRAVEPGS